MAAIGGDTIVPTNWPGLMMTAILVAAIAAVTYIGLEAVLGGPEKVEVKEGPTVQEVFSSSAQRKVAAAKPARALARAAFAPRDTAAGKSGDTSRKSESESESDATAASEDTQDDSDIAARETSADPAPTPSPAPARREQPAAAEPTPSPTRREETAAAEPTPAPTARPTATSRPQAPTRPDADALKAWWLQEAGSGLTVRFAGTLDSGGASSDAIAVMFSAPVDPAAANDRLELVDDSGGAAPGRWKVGKNPALLFRDGLASGRYELTVRAGLTAKNGERLAQTLQGPVYVY